MKGDVESRKALFESASIPRAVASLAIPAILTNLVAILYNLVDTYFVGQLGDKNMVAAVSLCSPVVPVFMAIATMIGVGGSSCIARAMGEKDEQKIRHISSFCFYASIGFGVIFMLLILLGMPAFLDLLGTNTDTREFTRQYLSWLGGGAVFYVMANSVAHLIRGEGGAKVAMTGMMIGTVGNIILDPVFIHLLGLGVAGAAIATVIGNALATGYMLRYLLRGNTLLSIQLSDFTVKNRIPLDVFAVGIPASISSFLMSAANIIANTMMIGYGTAAMAALGITQKVNMLVGMMQIGLAMGILPLIGYCYGAKHYIKLRKVVRFSISCTVVIGLVFAVICSIGARPIVGAFLHDEEVISLGVRMVRAYVMSGPLIGVVFVIMNTMQAMGKSLPSTLLSLSRQGFLFIPIAVVLNRLFALNGLIFAQPVADILAAVFAVLVYMYYMKRGLQENTAAETAVNNRTNAADQNKVQSI